VAGVRDTPVEVATTDYHTAGEPFRIVLEGVPEIPGATVAERRKRAAASEDVDFVRRLLCHEPRGHADMYGCFLVPPDDDRADLGVLFWHKDGYSTACGHGTIALGAWAVESGRVIAAPDGDTELTIDVPSGRVVARARLRDARVEAVTFRNVPSYVLARGVELETSRGRLAADVAYGGAIYASLDARAAGLSVEPAALAELIALGREVKRLLDSSEHARHPSDPRLSGIYGTIIFEDLGERDEGPHQRNVTVFADGEVDRSPCGSGTSARLALLAAEGRIDASRVLSHGSIVGTEFLGRVTETVEADGREALVTEVEGSAYRTGEHRFSLDPHDPLRTGFVLR
jgi:proline racemase